MEGHAGRAASTFPPAAPAATRSAALHCLAALTAANTTPPPSPPSAQVYVGGEFVGGADIVEQMASSGELKAAVLAASRG